MFVTSPYFFLLARSIFLKNYCQTNFMVTKVTSAPSRRSALVPRSESSSGPHLKAAQPTAQPPAHWQIGPWRRLNLGPPTMTRTTAWTRAHLVRTCIVFAADMPRPGRRCRTMLITPHIHASMPRCSGPAVPSRRENVGADSDSEGPGWPSRRLQSPWQAP